MLFEPPPVPPVPMYHEGPASSVTHRSTFVCNGHRLEVTLLEFHSKPSVNALSEDGSPATAEDLARINAALRRVGGYLNDWQVWCYRDSLGLNIRMRVAPGRNDDRTDRYRTLIVGMRDGKVRHVTEADGSAPP